MPCSAPSSRSSPAIRAAMTSASRSNAARCRAAAAGHGRASRRRGRTGSQSKKIVILAQMSLPKHPDLPNVPLIMDFAKTDEQRQIFKLIFARQVMGRPFLAPPGMPADRLAALRQAFAETMTDKAFLDDAAAGQIRDQSGPRRAARNAGRRDLPDAAGSDQESRGDFGEITRHCEEPSDEAIQDRRRRTGLLRGACHRAGHFGPDPLARNDESKSNAYSARSAGNRSPSSDGGQATCSAQ